MNKAELRFRHFLEEKMSCNWLLTWHEDRQISPGVPDLHYCMLSNFGRYRIGWLELKATDRVLSSSNKIHVEPSQHQYIRRWGEFMPIHFLIRVVDTIYLIPGNFHSDIPFVCNAHEFHSMDCIWFKQNEIIPKLPNSLKTITHY